MSNELATIQTSGSLPEQIDFAQALASASLLPRAYQKQPANILLAIQYGDALGIPPIQAINGIHVIEGKPSASADLIASLVRRAGHKLRIREEATQDGPRVTAVLIRADDPDFEFTVVWDMAKAREAGLTGKQVWKQYPGQMLRSRAVTEVCRQGAGDALYGVIYTPEELGGEEGAERAPRPAHTPQQVQRLADVIPAPQQVPTPQSAPSPVEHHEPADDGDAMTDAQTRKLGALLREHRLTTRDDQLAKISALLGRPVASRKELSKADASRVIDALDAEPVEPDVDADGVVYDAELVDDGREAV